MSRRSGRSRLTLFLLVITSITVLTLDFRGSGAVQSARDAAATVFAPVRSAADTVFRPVGNAWHGITDYGDVKAENERLREENEALRGDLVTSADAEQQLAAIAEAQGLPLTTDIPQVLARVVGGPVSSFEHTIQIGKGSDHNIRVGMPVVTGSGLVGRVVQVTKTSSSVQLLTDPAFQLGVRLVLTGEVGVAFGTGDGRPMRVDSIDPRIVVENGEAITTSQYARSIMPPDIPVGNVVSVQLSSDQREQLLTVEPLADLEALAYVTILLWTPAS